MSLRPWLSQSFLAASAAMAILFILLLAASVRLFTSENALTDYITEDMVWLSSQGQYEAVRYADALRGYRLGELSLSEVQLPLDLLSSRIAVLEQGEPRRQLGALGYEADLAAFRVSVDTATQSLGGLDRGDSEALALLHAQALELSSSLRNIANAALFAERERDVLLRQERRHTLFEVLATLVATMLASLLVAGILVRDHRQIASSEAALQREREVSRLHRSFISIVSHQFRTPLAIIDASAQRMIRRGHRMTVEEISSRAEKIRTACLRLTRLMESTLNAARVEEGEIAFRPTSCDLAELLHTVLDSQPEEDQKRLDLQLEELPCAVQVDTTLLEQAIQNLLSNAFKYSFPGTRVLLHARHAAGEIILSVCDKGVGVPADELGSLFRRFFRARTAEGIPGTGIGLSFVAHVMELHDGRVEVDSKEGQGSTFSLRFPARLPSIARTPETTQGCEVVAL